MEKVGRIALLALGGALVSGCDRFAGPKVESPLNGQYRYTCCNIRYEKPEISDVNYTQGALIPYGTRVQILEVNVSPGLTDTSLLPTAAAAAGLDLGHLYARLVDRAIDRCFT